MTNIRPAKDSDLAQILSCIEAAFPPQENHAIMTLVDELMGEITKPPILSLVAEEGDLLAGYVCFSPVYLQDDNSLSGYILAPLAVSPGFQGMGVGTKLVGEGITMLSEKGMDFLLVYGDPAYYGRFGFKPDLAETFVPPYKLQYPAGWQALAAPDDRSIPDKLLAIRCVAALNKESLW